MSYSFGKSIVTDGLVFCVDAANGNSYSGSGTTWTDLVGGNDGTLANGPTFDSANGGSFEFDGVDDCVTTSLRSQAGNFDSISSNEFTVITWFKPSGSDGIICGMAGGIGGGTTFAQFMSGKILKIRIKGTAANNVIKSGLSTSQYHMATYTWNGTTGLGYYNNETPISVGIGVAAVQSYNFGIADPRDGTLSNYPRFSGNIPICLVYDKALTAAEVEQNYNALKNRFI